MGREAQRARGGHGGTTTTTGHRPQATGTGTATRTRRHEDTRTATRARGGHDRKGARRAGDCREGLRRTASSNSFFASGSPAMSSHFTCRHPIHGKKATRRGAFSSRAARGPGFHSKNRPKTRKAVKYREEGAPPLPVNATRDTLPSPSFWQRGNFPLCQCHGKGKRCLSLGMTGQRAGVGGTCARVAVEHVTLDDRGLPKQWHVFEQNTKSKAKLAANKQTTKRNAKAGPRRVVSRRQGCGGASSRMPLIPKSSRIAEASGESRFGNQQHSIP